MLGLSATLSGGFLIWLVLIPEIKGLGIYEFKEVQTTLLIKDGGYKFRYIKQQKRPH